MNSVFLMILRKMIQDGRKPKLVVCCIAPRDCVSNDSGSGEHTYVMTSLKTLHEQYPELQLMRYPALTSAAFHLADAHEKLDIRRANMRAIIKDAAEHLAHYQRFPAPRATSAGEYWPDFKVQPVQLNSLASYRARYNPPNFAQCKEQIGYLMFLLNTCKIEGIQVAIVDMPLPEINLDLLQPDLLKLYRDGVASQCKKFDVAYIDLQRDDLKLDDYEDTCHLNTRGANRFFQKIAARLEPLLSQTFGSTQK